MFVTATFATETSAGKLPPGVSLTTTGRLHDIGSGVTTVALLLAALLSIGIFADRLSRLRIVALIGAVVCLDVALLSIGSEVAGVRQRALVAGACAWQLLALRALGARRRSPLTAADEIPPQKST